MRTKLRRDIIAVMSALIVTGLIVAGSIGYMIGSGPDLDWSKEPMAAPEGVYVVVRFSTTTIAHGLEWRTMDAYRVGSMWFLATQEAMGDRPLTPVNLPFVAWAYGPKE